MRKISGSEFNSDTGEWRAVIIETIAVVREYHIIRMGGERLTKRMLYICQNRSTRDQELGSRPGRWND